MLRVANIHVFLPVFLGGFAGVLTSAYLSERFVENVLNLTIASHHSTPRTQRGQKEIIKKLLCQTVLICQLRYPYFNNFPH